MNNRLKSTDRKGSITVEAAIVMPIFICVIINIAFFMKVIYVHEIIEHAITETANELASVSYLFTATGVKDIDEEIANGLNQKGSQFNEDMDTISKGMEAFKELSSEESRQTIDDGVNTVKDMLYNPIETVKSMVSAVGEAGYNDIKAQLVKAYVKKYLVGNTGLNINKRLEQLHVVGGFGGLEFSQSRLLSGDNGDIDIIVRYQMDVPVPIKILPDFYMVQRAVSKAWLEGKKTPSVVQEDNNQSIWELSPFERGKQIQQMDEYKRNLPERFPVIATFEQGTASMIKSINLNNATYQKYSNIRSKINGHIRELETFKGAEHSGVTITENNIKAKKLIVVVPSGTTNQEIDKIFEQCKQYAQQKGVQLIVNEL